VSERTRFTIRTSDEIVRRIEALAGISGESKNSVANVLLAMQLGGVTCGATSENDKVGENNEESETTTVVEHNSTDNSEKKSGATSKSKNKRVSSPPTPPSPSQKKKGILRIPKKEKVSSQIGHGRKPKNFEECLEYFKERRIPNPEQKAREFYDFYDGKGWVIGKSPIKKWSCCLTTWISHNPGWKPLWEFTPTGITLKEVLEWMEKEHPEWYEKHKEAKNINEIDGYYLDEYRN